VNIIDMNANADRDARADAYAAVAARKTGGAT